MTQISLTKMKLNDGALLTAAQPLDSEGGKIEFKGMDTKTLIVVENTGAQAKTITFLKGSSIQGVADLEKEIAPSQTQGFVLESGAFKSGGYVYAKGDTALKISVYLLP